MANPTDRMIGGANRWTNFVREWADKHSISYGCALSKPEMREAYKAKYGNRKRLTQTKEKELMGQEDKDAPEKPKPPKKKRGVRLIIEEEEEEEEEQPKKKGRPKKYATAEEARQAKIKNTIEARKRKKSGQDVVLSEEKEAEMMGKEDVNVARKKVMRPPSGPPPISAETVRAVKAKVADPNYNRLNSDFEGLPESDGQSIVSKKADKFGNRWIFGTSGVTDYFWGVLNSKGKLYNFKYDEYPSKDAEKYYDKSKRWIAGLREFYSTSRVVDLFGREQRIYSPLPDEKDILLKYWIEGDKGLSDGKKFQIHFSAEKLAELARDGITKEDYIKNFKYSPELMRGKGFNPLPEFAEQVEGAESGGGIEYLPDGCVLYTGGGIFGKKFDRFVKKTIGKKATKTIYKALDKTVKPLVNRGIDVGINALGAVQPELIPALQVGKKVLKGYIDRPTAYQENPTKELVKDINPVGLAVDYALGSGMEGGHWTPQMKPYLERELRNYQNIVHHLGQHLSDSGQKDPKDAMGFNHFGNEMRRVQKLLSTI